VHVYTAGFSEVAHSSMIQVLNNKITELNNTSKLGGNIKMKGKEKMCFQVIFGKNFTRKLNS